MLLVKEENGGLKASEYTLSSVYWDKKYKELGLKYLLWVEYNSSILSWNVYRGYLEDRCLRINNDLGVSFKIEEESESIERYKELERGRSMLISSYENILKSKHTLEHFISNDMDLTRETKNGSPLYKPKDVTSALLELEKISDMLLRIWKKIEVEFDESSKRLEKGDLNEFTD